MNWAEFQQRYNAHIHKIGASENDMILGILKKDGDAVLLKTKNPHISVIWFEKGRAEGVLVIGTMNHDSTIYALLSYGLIIDVIMGTPSKKRNEYFERLHLFDGKLRPQGSNLTIKGHLLEVRPHYPGKGLICFTVANTDKRPDVNAEKLIKKQEDLNSIERSMEDVKQST